MSNLCHYYIIISKFYWIHSFNCYKNNLFILSLSLSLYMWSGWSATTNPWPSWHCQQTHEPPAIISCSRANPLWHLSLWLRFFFPSGFWLYFMKSWYYEFCGAYFVGMVNFVLMKILCFQSIVIRLTTKQMYEKYFLNVYQIQKHRTYPLHWYSLEFYSTCSFLFLR